MALIVYTAGQLQETTSSPSLDETGLWLVLSWATLQRTDCKGKTRDFNTVSPIHSLSLVHSLTRNYSFKGFITSLSTPVKSHVLSKGSLTLLAPPLILSPRGDVSGFGARQGGLSLYRPCASHAAGNCYQLFPGNNPLRRSCFITSFSSTIPISCKICLQHIQQLLLLQRYLCSSKQMQLVCELGSKRNPDSI